MTPDSERWSEFRKSLPTLAEFAKQDSSPRQRASAGRQGLAIRRYAGFGEMNASRVCDKRDGMDRQAIIDRLKASEALLRALGVAHVALFGSRARGDNRPDSDLDILVEITPEAHIGLWGYVGIVHALEDMFPMRVDVSNRGAQKPHVRPTAERDAIYAF
jgi:hypothetical protein